jgi:hypothetical protein
VLLAPLACTEHLQPCSIDHQMSHCSLAQYTAGSICIVCVL